VPSLSDAIRQKKRALWLLPFVIVLFWLAMRWNAAHGAGFRFARDEIEASAALQTKIGKISNVSFPIFSRYSAHYGVGYSKIHLELKAKGDRGVANVELDIAEDDGGSWTIERSFVDGRPTRLDHQ
jgi:hypothetical protein